MYPHELEQFIRERKFYLNEFDLLKAISIKENPQLNHIKFDNNKYEMWDRYGNYYNFYASNNANPTRTRKKHY